MKEEFEDFLSLSEKEQEDWLIMSMRDIGKSHTAAMWRWRLIEKHPEVEPRFDAVLKKFEETKL